MSRMNGRKQDARSIRFDQFAHSLPLRNELHIARKIWHVLLGSVLVYAIWAGVQKQILVNILSISFVVVLGTELIRHKNPAFNERIVKLFGLIIRTNEVNRVTGIPFYVGSCLIAVAVFPKIVALLSISYLVIGDPIASFVGVLLKKNAIRIAQGKSFQGTGAAFIACSLVTWFTLKGLDTVSGINLIRLTLLGGFSGALSEMVPIDLDDNFTIPMISGLIMWLGLILIHFA